MKLQKVYHMGIPVDDLDRARDFYTKVLGMVYLDRVGGNPDNPDALPITAKFNALTGCAAATMTSFFSNVPDRSIETRSTRTALLIRPLT